MARRAGWVGSPLTMCADLRHRAWGEVVRERFSPYTATFHPGGRRSSAKPAIVKLGAAAQVSRGGYMLVQNERRTPMSVPSSTARVARFAIFAAAAATAFSVAACGTPNKGNLATGTSASPTSSSTAPAHSKGTDHVAGLIASVSGSTIQVTQSSGNATVDFTPSTKVVEVTPAQLTDVTAGSCVSVRPTSESAPGASAVTAQSVRVGAPVDGKCPQPKQQADSATTPPSSAAPAKNRGINGTVASVAGNTINVTSNDASGAASQKAVTVTDKTKYTKQTTTDGQAIAQGKCITARGTKDGGGTLQATAITLQPANNGKCPQPGGNHHGH